MTQICKIIHSCSYTNYRKYRKQEVPIGSIGNACTNPSPKLGKVSLACATCTACKVILTMSYQLIYLCYRPVSCTPRLIPYRERLRRFCSLRLAEINGSQTCQVMWPWQQYYHKSMGFTTVRRAATCQNVCYWTFTRRTVLVSSFQSTSGYHDSLRCQSRKSFNLVNVPLLSQFYAVAVEYLIHHLVKLSWCDPH